MAIAGLDHNQHSGIPSGRHAGSALVDRWTLTGTSPCCACTRGGRVIR